MMQLIARLGLLAAGLVLLAGQPASADGQMAARTLSKADKSRLAQYDTVSKAAILAARDGGSGANLKAANSALAASPQRVLGVDLIGLYRCRTIKLGGMAAVRAYGWFTCKIDVDAIGYRLTKITGGSRFSGHFIDESEKRLLYYGATHRITERPRSYGYEAARNQAGYFFKTGPKRFRLELPLPGPASKLDVIELERK